ncbi:hypothetical protein [Clostridium botulinum]|uniref:hypothetical protein n=1 Tax=Clostridium botulinum TaxID=1491 RepID=UPI0007730E39|nr:hypothetical protein [Clostridium botulinum]
MREVVEVLQMVKQSMSNEFAVAMLGIVERVNDNNTIDVQPMHTDNSTGEVFPIMSEVPVTNIGFGEIIISGVPQRGQWVIMLAIDYDIDNIFLNSMLGNNATDRQHSINDMIAIPINICPINTECQTAEVNIKSKNFKATIKPNGEMEIDTPKITLGKGSKSYPVVCRNGDGYITSNNVFARW